MELKDWLQIVVIPVSLGLVTLLWPHVQALNRKRRFMQLIDRELREVEPHPAAPIDGGRWTDHLKKTFLHQKIFKDPSQNRDFLLSVDADIAYKISQLWQAFEDADRCQWLYYFGELSKRGPSDKLTKNLKKWRVLIDQYHPSNTPGAA